MDVIRKYFPDLNDRQLQQFEQLLPLYTEWNAKINLISRKDILHLYERHVLHSLSIARIVRFHEDTSILDAGTGGGFPGIPLAIYFPDIRFLLVDSIGKKIMVVKKIAEKINLSNITAEQTRVENIRGKYDFIVSRAVTSISEIVKWIDPLISGKQQNSISNGLLYLKGGDFKDELSQLKYSSKVYPIRQFFQEPFFETKHVIHIFQVKS